MNYRMLMAAAVAALLLYPLGGDAAEKQKNDADTYRLLNLFGDVFERVRADYVEDIPDQELIEAAISGMLTSLDGRLDHRSWPGIS